MLARACHLNIIVPFPAGRWHGNLHDARQIFCRKTVTGLGKIGQRALEHDLTAQTTGLGTNVDNPVGSLHDLLVMLDHHHSVAEVAQTLEHTDQLLRIAGMQTYRRLVENV